MRRRDDGERPLASPLKREEKEKDEQEDAEEEEAVKEEKLKVVVRVRPLQKHEEPWSSGRTPGSRTGHQTDDAVDLRIEQNIVSWEKNGQLKTLLADAVFQGDATQDDVFHSVEDCIDGLLAGFDCSVFAYGQTGTGKTHTMSGLPHHDDGREDFSDGADGFEMRPEFGVVPRGIAKLFDCVDAARSATVSFSVYCSFVEIYNEKIYDILAPAPSDASTRKAASHRAGWNRTQPAKEVPSLPMRQKLDGSVFVDGLTSRKTSSRAELLAAFRDGSRHREVRDNLYNQHSSRGHSVFQVTLRRDATSASSSSSSSSPQSRLSRLFFVDLAGSEKWHVNGSELSDKYATELASINKSLSALTNCVLALTQRERPHVPFRDSVLTRLLQSCLQGSGRTAFIVTLSPARESLDESCATLRFAERLRAIKCRPVRRRIFSNELLGEQRHYYERQIQSMRAEVTRLRELLKKAQRRNQEIAEQNASAANQALVAENKRLKELLRNSERQRSAAKGTATASAPVVAASPQQQAARQILVTPRPFSEDDRGKTTAINDDDTSGGMATPPNRSSSRRHEDVAATDVKASDDEQLHSLVHRLQSNEARLHWMLEAEMEAQNTRSTAANTTSERLPQPVTVARSWAVERALRRKLVNVPTPVRAAEAATTAAAPDSTTGDSSAVAMRATQPHVSRDKENSPRQPVHTTTMTTTPRRPPVTTNEPSSQSVPIPSTRRAPVATRPTAPSLTDEPPLKSASILKLVGSSAADKMGKSKDELVDEYKRARRAELEAMLRTMVQR